MDLAFRHLVEMESENLHLLGCQGDLMTSFDQMQGFPYFDWTVADRSRSKTTATVVRGSVERLVFLDENSVEKDFDQANLK